VGLTQQELGLRLGFSNGTRISQWENSYEKAPPSSEQISRLASVLATSCGLGVKTVTDYLRKGGLLPEPTASEVRSAPSRAFSPRAQLNAVKVLLNQAAHSVEAGSEAHRAIVAALDILGRLDGSL
jgi:hypothetical protein